MSRSVSGVIGLELMGLQGALVEEDRFVGKVAQNIDGLPGHLCPQPQEGVGQAGLVYKFQKIRVPAEVQPGKRRLIGGSEDDIVQYGRVVEIGFFIEKTRSGHGFFLRTRP